MNSDFRGCPKCKSELTYVKYYDEWFCKKCQEYRGKGIHPKTVEVSIQSTQPYIPSRKKYPIFPFIAGFVVVIVIVLLVYFLFMGGSAIEGKWTAVDVSMTNIDTNETMNMSMSGTVKFKSDGTIVTTGDLDDGGNETSTWTESGDKITIKTGNETYVYAFEVEGDTLTFTEVDGNITFVLTFKKA